MVGVIESRSFDTIRLTVTISFAARYFRAIDPSVADNVSSRE
jgi:hypothetical protein